MLYMCVYIFQITGICKYINSSRKDSYQFESSPGQSTDSARKYRIAISNQIGTIETKRQA